MLTRRREQIFAILGLVALNAALVWYLDRLWVGYGSRTQWIYAGVAPRPLSTLAPSTGHAAEIQSFAEIVNRNLFSPDRTNQPPEQKEVKVPALPLLYGTMNLGSGWFALMAPGDQSSPASRQVLPGGEIGGYKLLSIGNSQVIVEWGEKRFTLDVAESALKVPRVVEKTELKTSAERPVQTVAASPSAPHVTAVASSPPPAAGNNANAPAALPADAPPGTVVGGKRKVIVPTPFGPQAYWEDVEQPGSKTTNQSPKKEQ